MKKMFLFLACLLLLLSGSGQSLPDSMIAKIDLLFKKWDTHQTPGCVVGIVKNDSLVYAKGYGLANLEDGTLNSPQSIYYMCSVSKQFTGFAITLLARQGKLKLDDDIHVYLPWMADFGKKITVRNLLNHTSGIRDDIGLAAIVGLPIDGMLTQSLALEILKKQHTLNFAPGEKFSYSNSNYVLLAEIVRVASGQSFRAYTTESIFKPLGMTNSRFIDDNREVISNRAAAYSSPDGKTFRNSYQQVYTLGDGGLFTSMEDMAHWVMNFYNPRAGDVADISQLTEKGKLNNGKEISYAFGINVDSSRGWKRYQHNGGLAGYRTIISIYPDLHIGFIVFGNSGDGETYSRIDQLIALLIPDNRKQTGIPSIAHKDSVAADLNDPKFVKELPGIYIAENGYRLTLSIRQNRLWLNNRNLLVCDSGNLFSLFSNPAVKYNFSIHATEVDLDLITPILDKPIHLVHYLGDTTLPDQRLQAYCGTYYCPELDCSYHIRLQDHHLYLANPLHPDAIITLIGRDHLVSDNDYLDHVVIIRGTGSVILGFELNSGEMMHLRFNKRQE